MAKGGINAVIASASKPVAAPDLRKKRAKGDERDQAVLPLDAPVTPLGIQGMKLWVLDAANQLQPMTTDCRKGDLMLICGGDAWLRDTFPQFGKPAKRGDPPPIKGFDQADAQAWLIAACHRKGIFDPLGRVFGRGAHRMGDDGDQLVLHMGRRVMIAGMPDKRGRPGPIEEHEAGEIDGRFYPALGAMPAPAAEPSTDAEGAELMTLFGEWNWTEPDAAALLLLGMSGQMHICGALEWRAHVWLAGNTASGKSTLQRLIRAIHHLWCLHTEDASEAAVRQVLNDDTLPVLIDEAEADDNPEKQRAMLNLMKKASSGAKMHRGSADHRAREFTAQSCFLFSSVLHGLVKGEELNRVAILNMVEPRRRKDDEPEWAAPDLARWRQVGRRMHRRMIEQWPRFERTLVDYKREIASHGFAGRWQDTFGTLLACADCLLYSCAPSAESIANDGHGREKEWVRRIAPLMFVTKVAARSDVERCLAHLLSRQIPGAHGDAPEAIGQWLERAMELNDPNGADRSGRARHRLKQYGLRVVTLDRDAQGRPTKKLGPDPIANDWGNAHLAVAYGTCEPLAQLFKGSEWSEGRWPQSLGKVEGTVFGLKIRFAGSPDNAIAIPLTKVKGEE